jgi:hypothetical protein
MIYISYYGNILGKQPDLENKPSYILDAMHKGFQVKIDVQWRDNSFYIGKQEQQYKVELNFFEANINQLWCEAINIETLIKLQNYFPNISIINNIDEPMWGYAENIHKNFICVLPEISKDKYEIRDLKKLPHFKGVCSSYVGWYKQLFEAETHYALTINGRLNCHQYNLLPQIVKYLQENQSEWLDVHIAINDDTNKIQTYLSDKYMDAPFIATFSCEIFDIPVKYINHHNHVQCCVIPRNVISNFYTMMIVSKQVILYQTYYHYSLILKYRPDIVSNSLPKLKEFLNYTNKHCVLTPDNNKHGVQGYCINDQLSIGNSDVLQVYLNIFTSIDEYLYKHNIVLHPETLLHHHLSQNNIQIDYMYYDYYLDDRRHNEDI